MEISEELALAMVETEAGKAWAKRAEKWDGQPYNIFISCSDKDRDVARQISATLGDLCINHFFYLKDMNWGDDIVKRVKDSVAQCTHLLLIATANSQGTPWVTYELGQADALDKGILAFVPDTTLQLDDVLKRHHYVSSIGAVREFFSRPNISIDAIDDFLAEVLGELPVPLAEYQVAEVQPDEQSTIWYTPRRPPDVKRGGSIAISGSANEPRVEVREWTSSGTKEQFRLEFDDTRRALRHIVLHGEARGVCLTSGEPMEKRLRGDKYGWRTSRTFWIETVKHLREKLGAGHSSC